MKITALLEKTPNNIDINKQDSAFKVSLLHTAAGIGSGRLVEIILKYNPDPFLKNCFDQTPAQRAREYVKNEALATRLENYQDEYIARKAAVALPLATPASAAPASVPVPLSNDVSSQPAVDDLMVIQAQLERDQKAAAEANERLQASTQALIAATKDRLKKSNPPVYAPSEPLPPYSQSPNAGI